MSSGSPLDDLQVFCRVPPRSAFVGPRPEAPNYQLGFPQGGRWLEVFNSDVYDDIGQRTPFGNGGAIFADGPPMDGFLTSAGVIVPANSVLVFARDDGD
jgi:hypothetical protein